MKFIKLSTIHPDDPLQDTELYMRPDDVIGIIAPSAVDKKRREKIKAIVYGKIGSYAVSDSIERILELTDKGFE